MRKGVFLFSIAGVSFLLLLSGYVEVVWGIGGDHYMEFLGERNYRKAGFAVIGTLDSDGDGMLEIIFSKVYTRTGTTLHIMSWEEGSGNQLQLITSIAGWNFVDFAVGDFNGDGYDDLALSNPYLTVLGFSNVGTVWIYYGSSTGLVTTGATILTPSVTTTPPVIGASVNLYWGWSIDSVEGDEGLDYLLIGAPGYTVNSMDIGYAALYRLGSNPDRIWQNTGFCDSSLHREHGYGACVRGLGDLNGDGKGDFGVSNLYNITPHVDGDGIHSDVHIYYRGDSTEVIWGTTRDYTEDASPTYFGSSFDSGDFNGDGYLDLIIGEPRTSGTSSKVYLYGGSSSGIVTNNPAASIVKGPIDFGMEVATIGDENGDNIDDFMVGAPLYDVTSGGKTYPDAGRVYVYEGAATLSQIPTNNNWNKDGENAYQYLGGSREGGNLFTITGGKSLCGLDSINSDTKKDLLIGSPYYDDSQYGKDNGVVWIYTG